MSSSPLAGPVHRQHCLETGVWFPCLLPNDRMPRHTRKTRAHSLIAVTVVSPGPERAVLCPRRHFHRSALSDESQAVPIPSRRSRRRGRVHRAARLVPRRIPTGRRRASPTACGCHRTRSSPPPHHRNPWTRATLTTSFHGLAGIRREPHCSHHRGHQLHPSSCENANSDLSVLWAKPVFFVFLSSPALSLFAPCFVQEEGVAVNREL